MTKSKQFFYSSLAFLIGVALSELWLIQGVWFLIFSLVALGSMYFFKKQKIIIFILLVLVIGNFYGGLFQQKTDSNYIASLNETKQTFVATICLEPDVRLDHQKLTVCPAEYKGKVLLKTSLYPEYAYGDKLEINCKLQTPEPIENFRYDKYLEKSGIASVCYQPRLIVLAKDQGNFFIAGILKIKDFVSQKINKTVAEPQAALVGGILLGTRQGIPADLLEKFNITGITHIIAISGFNITIIVVILLNFFTSLNINRKKSFYIILAGLVFFVVLTGMSPSVIRAAVMGSLVLFAKQIGRPAKIANVLVLSALIMVLVNPKILVWDAGFQLSFLSTIGLVYLSPVLLKYFAKIPTKFGLQENLTSTFSAIIFTLPLILFQFGRLSIVAPIVNLLVLPIIPIAMLVGFIQLVFSLINIFLGQMVGWISWLLLDYIIKVVEIFASFGWSAVNISISWWLMLFLYVVLFIIIFKSKKKTAH